MESLSLFFWPSMFFRGGVFSNADVSGDPNFADFVDLAEDYFSFFSV